MNKHLTSLALTLILLLAMAFPVSAYAEDCQHEWSDWAITKEASCRWEGTKERQCKLCGEWEETTIPATGQHSFGAWEVEEEPTCASTGSKVRYCTECWTREEQTIPATGQHSFSNWFTEEEATCGSPGRMSRFCYFCDKEETRTIPATGHHIFGKWYVSRKATIHAGGTNARECWKCGYVQTAASAKARPFVKFTKKTYSVKLGKTLNLKNKLKFASGDKIKRWRVKKSSVAGVNKKGKVQTKSVGTTVVTVTMKSGRKASCKVKVTRAAAKKKASSGRSADTSTGGGASGTVWLSATGSKYHSRNNCGNMNPSRSRAVSRSYAESMGYSPCSKCC